jgi:hypothetical protein
LFYEDAFIDTTFLGRRLVGTPETRWAGVALLALERGTVAGPDRLAAQLDASLGDRLQRGALSAVVRREAGLAWTLGVQPRVEYRRDRTFGRDLEQWQGEASGRARRTLGDAGTALELGVRGDLLRSGGAGSEYVPDRHGVRASVALERLSLSGADWRVGYGLAARAFPDSTIRDHTEHRIEAHARTTASAGHALVLELEGVRRTARRAAPTSRDDFREGRAALEGALRLGETWSLIARGELELTAYDRPDSTLYFDYHVVRVRLGPRHDAAGRWSAAAGARAEWLLAARAPAEEYWEIGGYAELERFAGAGWWSLSPAAGWRDYAEADDGGWPALHSAYAFLEATLAADQPLPGALRLRVTGAGRLEWHLDQVQDARSLYISCELRRLF